MKKRKKNIIIENLEIIGYAAEGKALAKDNGKAIFVSGAVPGDIVDVFLTKNKADWAEARVQTIKSFSKERLTPFCKHFGICGGCKWQMLPYEKQLEYKEQETIQNIKRIGKIDDDTKFLKIIGSTKTTEYRNKLEFTASNKPYLEKKDIDVSFSDSSNIRKTAVYRDALGFHAPRIFDKIIDIQECFLMDSVNNVIRSTVRDFAKENNLPFYDIRLHTGWLRNIIIRHCNTGELMINVCINYEDELQITALLNLLLQKLPNVTSLLYTINTKWNDSIYDLNPVVFYGTGYVIEKLEDFKFMIGPKSFFQTNTLQAEKLYSIARDFAGLTGKEILYDLYCGTGSIGIFCSKLTKKIIGVELIEDAIEDAKKNAEINNVDNALFFAGDVIKICNDDFFKQHGAPDVVIVDPPRVGMHEKLIQKLLDIAAPKIVYVSCNTATQARDIALLSSKYFVEKIQPVDMFPHTHHIESVGLLILKK